MVVPRRRRNPGKVGQAAIVLVGGFMGSWIGAGIANFATGSTGWAPLGAVVGAMGGSLAGHFAAGAL